MKETTNPSATTPPTVEIWSVVEGAADREIWTAPEGVATVINAWMDDARAHGYSVEIYEIHHGPECYESPEPCHCSQYATDHHPTATHNHKEKDA